MPKLMLCLPDDPTRIDPTMASIRAAHFARYLAMASARQLRDQNDVGRIWLEDALGELSHVIEALGLKIAPDLADPVGSLIERLSERALNRGAA